MFEGLYTALITPFNANNELDEEGFKHNIKLQLANDVKGIAILGTTGENPTISHEERKRIIRIARKEWHDNTLIVGTGSNCTQKTIEQTQEAADLGADIALIIAPYYNKPTQQGAYLHYVAISEKSPIPILLYNSPSRTGFNLLPSTLIKLAHLPNIIGIKESSGNMDQMAELIELTRESVPNFSVFTGDDAHALTTLALGGKGLISVTANLFPGPMVQLVNMCLEGNCEHARDLFYRLLPLMRLMFIETNPIPVKAAMEMMGLPAGGCRLPLNQASPETILKLKEYLAQTEIFQCR